jgi:hypothetical protein
MTLKEIIDRLHIKSYLVAERIGMSHAHFCLVVNSNKPLPKKYHSKLAAVLGVRVGEIRDNNIVREVSRPWVAHIFWELLK